MHSTPDAKLLPLDSRDDLAPDTGIFHRLILRNKALPTCMCLPVLMLCVITTHLYEVVRYHHPATASLGRGLHSLERFLVCECRCGTCQVISCTVIQDGLLFTCN